MMDRTISATEAARTFSDVLNRIRYQGVTFTIERGGEVIARIVPAGRVGFAGADLAALLRAAPRPDKGFADALEATLADQAPIGDSAWER
jgi:antitoxin (DNA-binding transcriptional repressor) of toxin-antitoxin stability system